MHPSPAFRALALAVALAIPGSASAQAPAPAPSGLKSSDEILKQWNKPLTRARPLMRTTTAPGALVDGYMRSLSAVAGQPGGQHRGIEVVKAQSQSQGGNVQVTVQVDPASAISFSNILFKIGTAELLDEASKQQVALIAEAMKQKPETAFLVEGHTCDLGADEPNKLLSQERASLIVAELARLGVSPRRLLPLGYGEAEPATPNTSEEARQQNRRVTIYKRS